MIRVKDLRVDYDMCDNGNIGGICANTPDPLAANLSPNQIHKVNLTVMTQSISSNKTNTQNMQLSTAVSVRNLDFKDRYQ